MKKKLIGLILCAALIAGGVPGYHSTAASQEEMSAGSGETGSGSGSASGLESGITDGSNGDMIAGNGTDISISGLSVKGSQAGGKVTISFTATGNANSRKHYTVDSITKIYPVLDGSFPFEMTDEAYRVTQGTGTSLSCSYTLQARDNLETGYYLTGFMIVYGRKATDNNTTAYDSDYYVTKSVNIRLTGTKKVEPTTEPEPTAKDSDITMSMKNAPAGVYGQSLSMAFTVSSSTYKITSVSPVIGENFPFETSGDAYKTIRSKGSKSLGCRYHFLVKNNVSTGYQAVGFQVTYLKNGTELSVTKNVNVQLTGKKEKKEGEDKGKNSVPRVMVMGYSVDKKKIKPNSTFRLTLQVKNNAGKAVQNLKFTLSTENGEFLPLSGASTAYVDAISSKGTVNLSFAMQVGAGLGAKAYPLTIKSEYEDSQANAYSGEDKISIPVTVDDRLSLTDIVPPDYMVVGDSGDVTFSINNQGVGNLYNVTASCKGDGVSSEETYVGNIGSGSTSYADIPIEATEATGDGDGTCQIIIKYENASGEKKTFQSETSIYVDEEMAESDMEGMEEDYMDTEETQKKSPIPWIIAGVIAVVVVIIVVCKIRKKRRLRREEEELMEDELQ